VAYISEPPCIYLSAPCHPVYMVTATRCAPPCRLR